MGAVIHCVMAHLSCGLMRVRSSFLPVFSVSPDFSYPTLSLPVYHVLIIFLAVAVFGVEQFVIVLWLAPFSRLGCFGALVRLLPITSSTGS